VSARSDGRRNTRGEVITFGRGTVKYGKKGMQEVQTNSLPHKTSLFLNLITFDFPFYFILSDPNTAVPVDILFDVLCAHARTRVCVCVV
jgi:hypothetical protein